MGIGNLTSSAVNIYIYIYPKLTSLGNHQIKLNPFIKHAQISQDHSGGEKHVIDFSMIALQLYATYIPTILSIETDYNTWILNPTGVHKD